MILATRFTFIVERSWKNMHFHPKLAWPPATYDIISRIHSNWPSLNSSQNVREGWTNSHWKRQVLMFNPLGKISEKPYGGWHPFPPPSPCTSEGKIMNRGQVYYSWEGERGRWGDTSSPILSLFTQTRDMGSCFCPGISFPWHVFKGSRSRVLTRLWTIEKEYLYICVFKVIMRTSQDRSVHHQLIPSKSHSKQLLM